MTDIQGNLVELTKDFIKFADDLYKNQKINEEIYREITDVKKEFIGNLANFKY